MPLGHVRSVLENTSQSHNSDEQGHKPGGKFGMGDDDRLLSCPNYLLAKLAVLKHLAQ